MLLKAAGHSGALLEGVVSIFFHCTQEEAAEQLHAVHLWFLPTCERINLGGEEEHLSAHTTVEAALESCCANKCLFVCLCSPQQLPQAELCFFKAGYTAPENR